MLAAKYCKERVSSCPVSWVGKSCTHSHDSKMYAHGRVHLVLAKAMCGTGPLMEMSLLCPTARPQSFMWHRAIHRLCQLYAPQLDLQTNVWHRAIHNLGHLCAPQLNLYVCVCASATDVSRKHDHLDESKPVIVGCMFTTSTKHRLRKGNFHLVKQCPLTTTHLWSGLEQSKYIY